MDKISIQKNVAHSQCFLCKLVIGMFCNAVLCLLALILKENTPRLVALNQK